MEQISRLPEPAHRLWNIVTQLSGMLPPPADDRYWMLGGGTLLAGRWREHGPPRSSEDVDIKIRAPANDEAAKRDRDERINGATAILQAAGGELAGLRKDSTEEQGWTQTWVFPEKGAGKIDLVELHATSPWTPHAGEVEGVETLLEPTASILCGKLWRSELGLARDGFDIAVAGELVPSALDEALVVLGREKTGWAMEYLRRNTPSMEIDAQTEDDPRIRTQPRRGRQGLGGRGRARMLPHARAGLARSRLRRLS